MTECEDPLLEWRSEFPILAGTNYLVSNSLGAMPRGVYDSLRAYADTWASRGIRAWGEGWWEMSATVGDRIGALIAASPGTISWAGTLCLVPSRMTFACAADILRNAATADSARDSWT